MQRHSKLYTGICIALALGTLICLALIAAMLLTMPPQVTIHRDAYYVQEVLAHARI